MAKGGAGKISAARPRPIIGPSQLPADIGLCVRPSQTWTDPDADTEGGGGVEPYCEGASVCEGAGEGAV
eukprot:scaffold964_cov54-Isochrysis_galbana.AAC.1